MFVCGCVLCLRIIQLIINVGGEGKFMLSTDQLGYLGGEGPT